MQVLAIIPARGGSKGIPGKNVCLLAGEPLIAHMIKSAQKSKYISRIIVSTDDPEIARISKGYGAEVVWRPAEISGDTAPSESALLHSIEHLKKNEGYLPDLTVFLQCTSPLASAEDIDQTIAILLNTKADCAFSATESHQFLWKIGQNGFAQSVNHNPEIRPRRQEMEPHYRENGAIYVMRTKGFVRAGHRFFGNVSLSVMPPERSLDIDTSFDFKIAEFLLKKSMDT